MISLTAALLLGSTFPGIPASVSDPQAVFDRFRKECTGKKPVPASCRALRLELEGIVLGALKAAEASATSVDPAALRAAAHAWLPALRVVALRGLARVPFTPQDKAVLAQAFDDPVPAVRLAAMALAWKDKELQAWAERSYETVGKVGFIDRVRLWPDIVPSDKELGAPAYPGATYRYFASGPKRAFFTTPDPPAKVTAFYGTGSRKVLTAAQLRAAAARGADPAAMATMMRDPAYARKMAEDARKLQAMVASGAVPEQQSDWTKTVEDVEGIEAPRYVVLQETTMFGMTSPSKVVIVWKDAKLGKTAVVFPRAAAEPDPLAGLSPRQRLGIQATLDAMTRASQRR